ncbi:universal stress protein UspA [Halobacteriales archaeon QS_1_68_17]|nr:MAG: universal stress protein UspA [Halobacteriales archaeon QS_1_68_17]
MSKRILVPVDRSEQAMRAVDFAVEEFPAAELVLFHVINPTDAGYSAQASIPSYSEEWYENEKQNARRLFEEVRERTADRGIETETATEVGKPSRAIVAYADEHDIDHIVMGSHGREGVTRILLGSVAEAVVRHSPVSVTVAR